MEPEGSEEDGPGRRWGCRRSLKCTLMDLELGWLPIISDILLGCRWTILHGPLNTGLVLSFLAVLVISFYTISPTLKVISSAAWLHFAITCSLFLDMCVATHCRTASEFFQCLII